MDIQLIKTFLAVVTTESFVAAADRIHVTQSTVSQRIQKLEELVGNKLFDRSKSGAEATLAGKKFEQYARSMTHLWDEALYQTSLPEGFTNSLSLGCEESLWPELSANWAAKLTQTMKTTTFNFRTADPENLSNLLFRGLLDMAVMYRPVVRPGFEIEHVMDDNLVLVTGMDDHDGVLREDYIYTKWGVEFDMAHSRWFPSLNAPQSVFLVGPALAQYLIANKKTSFLPYRVADDYIAEGKLHFVKNGPEYPYPSYAVWTDNKPAHLLENILQELRSAAQNAPWIELEKK